jgi:hypothetical protein
MHRGSAVIVVAAIPHVRSGWTASAGDVPHAHNSA